MAKAKIKSYKIKDTLGDRVLNKILGTFMTIWIIVTLYPLIYVVSASISSPKAIQAGLVVLWPVDFTLESYEFVLQYRDVWIGYRNSVFYTICDWAFQTFCTVTCAYAISRRYFQGRGFVVWFLYGIRFFGAGMIPGYILKCNLGLYNNIWAVLISGTIATGDMLMLRAAINSNVPEDLLDAARIDGANHYYCIWNIIIPLTKATISVLSLYAMVGMWNEYFTAMLYLRDSNLFPLQLVLRPIMTAAASATQNSMNSGGGQSLYEINADKGLDGVRYALIIISSVPPIVGYMVAQKAFKGGVMVGAVKG